ncbi:biotin-dependent enzyme [Antricoccus suffuscus]|uniref:Biotin-dependent enzyme n=1 Tax=Antricoccus suffuscus TaxID=1629062 RepID=A0A2T0ZWT1_9ACTN|nr:carboxyl transferase domain-containing protein [Antricoccus suffuscus]PRZ40819.1 biotin-dependent enzyme [Antricoccus suffuscus]
MAVLVGNRAEIAVRVIRALAALDIESVAVYADDDADAMHVGLADRAVALNGTGAAAYLDVDGLVAAAVAAGCDAIHPGYGFLSESAALARACSEAGLTFVGPSAQTLDLFGDKTRAREFAISVGARVLPGTNRATSLDEAREFMHDHGALMVKAIAGGGGRGVRRVLDEADLAEAFDRSASEALASFGSADLYVEKLITRARHIEVQIVGDGVDVVDLGERDCTIQRRHQKLVELAPSPFLDDAVRSEILASAKALAAGVKYQTLGTFEFLVDMDATDPATAVTFMEANPRVQVEHTVTEEVTGVDLVAAQIRIAFGARLEDVGLAKSLTPQGFAVQTRVNSESYDGTEVLPSSGELSVFDVPSGPGVRVDHAGYVGMATNPRYDSLLAKVITRAPSFDGAVRRNSRALREFVIDGLETNIAFLQAILASTEFTTGAASTAYVDADRDTLLASASQMGRVTGRATRVPASVEDTSIVSADSVTSHLAGVVVSVEVTEGARVQVGMPLLVIEAMKMEHVITADRSGVAREITAQQGDAVRGGVSLLRIETEEHHDASGALSVQETTVDLDQIRPDLAEVIERHDIGLDERRPKSVARRRKTGHRTARENLADLCDDGSFVEYGALALAAQRQRRSVDDLIENTPADGLVCGTATVNADLVGEDNARAIVLSYDYTVLAGTQGLHNHQKTDRMFEMAERQDVPIVFYAEGGGGRPGDTDTSKVAWLDVMSFHTLGRLSGQVPSVGIVAGRCFAGNAAFLGCLDVVIATRDANIGMGGPAMIEGGGLGVVTPEQVGPTSVQTRNGVIDVLVEDEAEATAVAKKYLSYFQGATTDWTEPDARALRHVIPENRVRVYDIRNVVDGLADVDSVLELRRDFGIGMVTALIRIEGRPMGLIANNPAHLGGAIDAEAADKAARFLQLCDAHGLPVVSLCDTPGFMVGPESEEDATVRHFSRMFVCGANLTVPMGLVIVRKGYGLGAMAMSGGSFKAPEFAIAWPTGEIGAMGLEGAVRLGYRNEIEAISDPEEQKRYFDKMVDRYYEIGKGINAAAVFEIDDVIDPAATRRWIARAMPPVSPDRTRRTFVDTW